MHALQFTTSSLLTAGVDEAGRGPCAGPVVAAAVILPNDIGRYEFSKKIRDSKKLSAKMRDQLYIEITRYADCAIAEIDAAEIDRINILNATLLAMKNAVERLPRRPEMVLVDGNRLPEWGYLSRAIIGGDNVDLSIAAASIIAKVHRDRLMIELSAQHPQYGFDKHMGYPTEAHLSALARYGITPHHRKSYAPVRRAMGVAA